MGTDGMIHAELSEAIIGAAMKVQMATKGSQLWTMNENQIFNSCAMIHETSLTAIAFCGTVATR